MRISENQLHFKENKSFKLYTSDFYGIISDLGSYQFSASEFFPLFLHIFLEIHKISSI